MPGLFDRFRQKKQEQQMSNTVSMAATPQGQQAVIQTITPPPTPPNQSMDPRNGIYTPSEEVPSPADFPRTDVHVGASKGEAMSLPEGEDANAEPANNGNAAVFNPKTYNPFPTGPMDTGEGDVVEPIKADTSNAGDSPENVSDLDFLQNIAAINKEEEERRTKAATAYNALGNLARAAAAFGNYAFASPDGAPAISLPKYQNADVEKWQSRMDAQRVQYENARRALDAHNMQMRRNQQQLELEKQKVDAANDLKAAQTELAKLKAEEQRMKIENGGISPELQAKLNAAAAKEERLARQFEAMYGINSRRVAVQEQNARNNTRRTNAYIINRGGSGNKPVEFIIPERDASGNDSGYGGRVVSVDPKVWNANRRTLARLTNTSTKDYAVGGKEIVRKDADIDGDIIANWNEECDELINQATSVSSSGSTQKPKQTEKPAPPSRKAKNQEKKSEGVKKAPPSRQDKK